MLDNQPLQPFAPPADFFKHLPNDFSTDTIVVWILLIIFAFWAIYTIIAIYHWLKYSHSSWVAVPAIALHLFVSFVLIGYTLYGYGLFL